MIVLHTEHYMIRIFNSFLKKIGIEKKEVYEYEKEFYITGDDVLKCLNLADFAKIGVNPKHYIIFNNIIALNLSGLLLAFDSSGMDFINEEENMEEDSETNMEDNDLTNDETNIENNSETKNVSKTHLEKINKLEASLKELNNEKMVLQHQLEKKEKEISILNESVNDKTFEIENMKDIIHDLSKLCRKNNLNNEIINEYASYGKAKSIAKKIVKPTKKISLDAKMIDVFIYCEEARNINDCQLYNWYITNQFDDKKELFAQLTMPTKLSKLLDTICTDCQFTKEQISEYLSILE